MGEGVLPMVMCSRELLGDVRCLVQELGVLALHGDPEGQEAERRRSTSAPRKRLGHPAYYV